jgi:flavin reductase (DIM6/NTAB) family NADH-FMN oxidoreductase RutF
MSSGDHRFVQLMASLDSPMAIVTTASDGQQAGCLIGFHSQCSIDPVRYAVWLSKANRTCRLAVNAAYLGVHFLEPTAGHRQLAELFGTVSGDDIDKFERCAHQQGPEGLPLLTECANRFVGRRVAMSDDGSDHVCFVVEPITITSQSPMIPLRFHTVEDLSAGHDADEAPT